jgi:prophage regulatory protein
MSEKFRKADLKLLRIRQVMVATGVSRMTIYRLEKRGEFPRRVSVSINSVAWHESAVNNWIASRPIATRTRGPALQRCVRP